MQLSSVAVVQVQHRLLAAAVVAQVVILLVGLGLQLQQLLVQAVLVQHQLFQVPEAMPLFME
jgi:hypothetical protein